MLCEHNTKIILPIVEQKGIITIDEKDLHKVVMLEGNLKTLRLIYG